MADENAENDGLTWVERTRRELMSTPEGRAALADVEEREKHLVQQPCSAGNCVEFIDSRTGENAGGWGPVGCPCQSSEPGWFRRLARRFRPGLPAHPTGTPAGDEGVSGSE